LRRSLADAEREHEAGDLAEDDYDALRRRDEAALASVEAELGGLDPDGDLGRALDDAETDGAASQTQIRRRRRRWWIAGLGVVALVAGTVVLVVALTSPRLPGQGPTGGIQLDPAQQITQELDQAATEVRQGHDVQALALYRAILALDPNQPEALAEWGWLTWQAADATGNAFLEGQAETALATAVAAAPDFPAAHLYLGTVRLKGHNDPARAVAQYRLFLAENPPASELAGAAPFIRQAFAATGQPLPAGVPAG
jgi:tetratricopeptide (TPR) repeat protein